MKFTKKEYNRYVADLAPKSPLAKDLVCSFCIGGLICALGQLILNGWKLAGLDADSAGTATSVSLIFISAVLTGLSIYDDIAKVAGAGTIVPITGFANSVVSPAIELGRRLHHRHGGENVRDRRAGHRLRHGRERGLRPDSHDFRSGVSQTDFCLCGFTFLIRCCRICGEMGQRCRF